MFKFPTTTSNTSNQVYMFQFLVLSSSSTSVHWTFVDGYQTQKCDCHIGFQHGHTNNNVFQFSITSNHVLWLPLENGHVFTYM
jgi:hypothetical protein